jgi:NADH dehydrogenase (ubiquinone) Fe-S protein 3
MKILIDITCVDFPTNKKRFQVVYHILSVAYNTRLRLKVYASESDAIPSIEKIYASAGWFERET